MIICNNPCSSVPLILVIRRTVLFVKNHLSTIGTIVPRDIVPRDTVPRDLVARDTVTRDIEGQ